MKEFTGSFLLGSVILLSVLAFFGGRGDCIRHAQLYYSGCALPVGNCSAPGTRKGGTGRWKTLELLLASF